MPRAEADLEKVTMNLFYGDWKKLQSFYPDTGASPIVRRLIRSFVEQIEAGTPVANICDVKVDL